MISLINNHIDHDKELFRGLMIKKLYRGRSSEALECLLCLVVPCFSWRWSFMVAIGAKEIIKLEDSRGLVYEQPSQVGYASKLLRSLGRDWNIKRNPSLDFGSGRLHGTQLPGGELLPFQEILAQILAVVSYLKHNFQKEKPLPFQGLEIASLKFLFSKHHQWIWTNWFLCWHAIWMQNFQNLIRVCVSIEQITWEKCLILQHIINFLALNPTYPHTPI